MDDLVTIDVDALGADITTTLEGAATATGMLRSYPHTVSAGILERVAQLIDGADSAVVVARDDVPEDATWVLHEAGDLLDTMGDESGAERLRELANMLDTGSTPPDWAPTRGGVAVAPSGLAS
jgi:hypothetical protein